MDNAREKVNEQIKSRRRKLFVGLMAIIVIVIGAIMIEKSIDTSLTDVTIEKTEIPEEKAKFIPLSKLDTSIIAVKLNDGSYRLAFDACMGCYSKYGKHARFRINPDNTGLVCKNCKSEVAYEDMGDGYGEADMPYPIYESEITVDEDAFTLTTDYLEKHRQLFENLKKGKDINNYSENPEK